MKLFSRALFTVLFASVMIALISGCASSKKKEMVDETVQETEAVEEVAETPVAETMGESGFELNGDSDSMRAGDLRTVNFPFDSSVITDTARSVMEGNLSFLKEHTNLKIQIEGHCDERGGIQYNLALGERRAKALKDYLMASGISPDRVSIISYGKERPLEFGHDEMAWAKNRRGNFVIIEK